MTPRIHVIPVALVIALLVITSCGGDVRETPGKGGASRASEHAGGHPSSTAGDSTRPFPHEGEPGPESKLTLPREKWVDPASTAAEGAAQ